MIYGTAGIGSETRKGLRLHWGTIEKLKHTIEPFATYTYVPQVNQNDLPLYDETDRMEARSLFTYGFTSRIFAKIAAPAPSQAPEGGDGEVNRIRTISPFRARTFGAGGSDRGTVPLQAAASLRHHSRDCARRLAHSRTSMSPATVFPTNDLVIRLADGLLVRNDGQIAAMRMPT